MGEVAYTRDKTAQAWDYIRAHPAIFLRLTLRRCFRFWSGTGSAGAPLIYELHALLTSLLGFAGLAFLYRNRMQGLCRPRGPPPAPLPASLLHHPRRVSLPPQPRPPPHPPRRLRRHPTRHPLAAPEPHTLYSATTGFLNSPIPSIVITISSPTFSQRCGVRPIPTPAGVPVLITSPTCNATIPDRYSISAGIL